MSSMPAPGSLIIVSGPSGAGKSALSGAVLSMIRGICFSISYTTRPPRGNERNGVEYYFVSKEDFQGLIRRGELLEWAEVYGNYYGTAHQFIDSRRREGFDVLLDIDVQGAHSIREKRPDAVSIFIMPPSYQVLKTRLEERRLDKEYVIEQRLAIARREVMQFRQYDYLIINETFERSVEELKAIILGIRCRIASRTGPAESIIATFGGLDAESA